MRRGYASGNHKLGGAAECREAIDAAQPDDPVTLEVTEKGLRFSDAQGRPLGTLTNRHGLAKHLAAGHTLLRCEVAWTQAPGERYPNGVVSVRAAYGDPEHEIVKWMRANSWGKPRQPRPAASSYPVNVVGGSNYQDAIGRCRAGDVVLVCRQPDNPHDSRAIVVVTSRGETIGYIGRDSWLQRAIHDEGSGVTASIQSLHAGRFTAVVLSVEVDGSEVRVMPYSAPATVAPNDVGVARLTSRRPLSAIDRLKQLFGR